MRVLLIDDDVPVADSVQEVIESEGHVCNRTDTGEEGVEIAKLYDYDVIVLELELPDIEGIQVVRRLRQAAIDTPILVLSGRDTPEDKIAALKSGADDYLTKPYCEGELIARLHTLVRRSNGYCAPTIRIGRLGVNIDAQSLEIDGKLVRLTTKEYSIIELLALRKGRVLNKEAFLSNLYDGRDEPCSKIIDVFICKLRRKLAQASGGEHFIETVWGRGFILRDARDDTAGQGQAALAA